MRRTLIFAATCLSLASCGPNEHFNRGYVISQSHFEEEQKSDPNQEELLSEEAKLLRE